MLVHSNPFLIFNFFSSDLLFTMGNHLVTMQVWIYHLMKTSCLNVLYACYFHVISNVFQRTICLMEEPRAEMIINHVFLNKGTQSRSPQPACKIETNSIN